MSGESGYSDESADSDNYCNFYDSSKARDPGGTGDSSESCDFDESDISGE